MRILHLSDFHFRGRTKWDSDPVLSSLIEQLHEITSNEPMSLIVVTGDVAFSGNRREYQLAEDWFNAMLTGPLEFFPRENLLIVPGNHDVNRAAVGLGSKAIQKLLLDKGQAEIAEVLQNKAESNLMFNRFKYFNEFTTKVYRKVNKFSRPWWGKVIELDGFSLGIAGYNSSWVSSEDNEQGNLLIGQFQLNEVYHLIKSTEFKIALTHHPLSYLREFDGNDVGNFLMSKFNLHLRGHLHKEQAWSIRDPSQQYFELAAGSCYAGSNYPNSFHVIDINLQGSREIRINPYSWQGTTWIRDRNIFSETDGTGVFRGF